MSIYTMPLKPERKRLLSHLVLGVLLQGLEKITSFAFSSALLRTFSFNLKNVAYS